MERLEVIRRYLDSNKEIIPIREKIPFKGWREKKYTFDELASHDGNISWILGATDLVVDVDPRNGGDKSFRSICKKIEVELEPSVFTAGGGFHCFLSYPKGIDIRTKLTEYPGIDFLHQGKHCVMPSSSIGDKKYTFASDDDGFVQNVVPDGLLELLRRENPAPGINLVSLDREKVEECLAKIPNSHIEYDTWISIGMALHEWDPVAGLCLWEKWSSVCPKKEGTDYKKKWETFQKGKGITEKTITWEAGKEWMQDWVFVSSGKRFLKKTTKKSYDMTAFNFINGHNIKLPKGKGKGGKPLASKVLMDHGDVEVVDSMICAPNMPDIFTFQRLKVCNSFDKELLPKAEQITPEGRKIIAIVEEFFWNICNDNAVKTRMLMSWFASQVQNLGEKIRWVPVIVGGFRIGKTSILGLILEKLLGGYSLHISNDSLTSNFKDFMVGSLVVVIDELRIVGRDKYQTSLSLRNAISDKFVSFEVKHCPRQTLPNYTNYIAFSNYIDAVPVKSVEEAARWWIMRTEMRKKSVDYYTKIIHGIEKYAGQILTFFREEYEIDTTFCAHEKPGGCDVDQTIESNKQWTLGYEEARELLEGNPGEFWCEEYICPEKFFEAVAGSLRGDENVLSPIRRLNAIERGKLREELGMRKRIRVVVEEQKVNYYVRDESWGSEDLIDAITRNSAPAPKVPRCSQGL